LARHQLEDRRMDTIYRTGGNTRERLFNVHRLLRDAAVYEKEPALRERLDRSSFTIAGKAALWAKDVASKGQYAYAHLFNLIAKGAPYRQRQDGAIYYHGGWAR